MRPGSTDEVATEPGSFVHPPDRTIDATEPEPAGLTSTATLVEMHEELGGYLPCYELASGGMATVYLAVREGPHGVRKLAAVKRIHPHLAKKREFVEMFLDEARIASMVSHPNVCPVLDFGEAAGTYYLAMEYLVGEPVSATLRALSALPWEAWMVDFAMRVVADAAEGLHAAHELVDADGKPLGVVHRDVSPQNLFVTYDGGMRVVDFGIAQAENRLHHTETGALKGKFSYMAPEQLRARRVDRRADVWALGVVLWELLMHDRLFRRPSDAETITAVQNDPIPLPSLHRAGIPTELDDIVLRALSRDPDGRHESARELAAELERCLKQRPDAFGKAAVARAMTELFPHGEATRRELARSSIEARPRTLRRRAARRRAMLIGVLGVAALGVAFGAGALLSAATPPDGEVAEPTPEPPAAEPPPEPGASMVAPNPQPAQPPPAVSPTGTPEEPASNETAPARGMRSARAGFGTIRCVASGSWAYLWIDGQRHECPGVVRVRAGNRRVRVQPLGRGPTRTRRVRVRAGEQTPLRIEPGS